MPIRGIEPRLRYGNNGIHYSSKTHLKAHISRATIGINCPSFRAVRETVVSSNAVTKIDFGGIPVTFLSIGKKPSGTLGIFSFFPHIFHTIPDTSYSPEYLSTFVLGPRFSCRSSHHTPTRQFSRMELWYIDN